MLMVLAGLALQLSLLECAAVFRGAEVGMFKISSHLNTFQFSDYFFFLGADSELGWGDITRIPETIGSEEITLKP